MNPKNIHTIGLLIENLVVKSKSGSTFFNKYIVIFLWVTIRLYAQTEVVVNSPQELAWETPFKEVGIVSSKDKHIQKAFLYSSTSPVKAPLIVSLHSWSADYTQDDPLTKEVLARDWNYIHPDFCGADKTPEAMGSQLVIAAIEDAILYALQHTNADPNEVHIIGTSGGGYATLLAYMNIKYPVKSFSAWAPISDINAWYWQSVGRKQKYAADIIAATSADSIYNREEAIKRSPLWQNLPQAQRQGAYLYIYEGVHDGYTGSVPITHSIDMYNKVVGQVKLGVSGFDKLTCKETEDPDMVSDKETIALLSARYRPDFNPDSALYSRNVYLKKTYKNISLTIFEGTHEQLPQALGLLPVTKTADFTYNILTLGDSNGANPDGWVTQLEEMLPKAHITNISRGGRTIGFDNNGDKDLNALRNIDTYLNQSIKMAPKQPFDYIVLCLGTNDTKKVFEGREEEVVANFKVLLRKIKTHKVSKNKTTKFIYISPPPVRTYNILEKYEGSNQRLAQLVPQLLNIAREMGFETIDVYHPLQGILDYYSKDGVHMSADGQRIIASKMVDMIITQSKN